VLARGTDNSLWAEGFDGHLWTGWRAFGGAATSAPTLTSWGPGRQDVFVAGTDSALWHRWFDGSWSEWESLGGQLTSAPTVVAWDTGRLDVVARGADNAAWHRWFDGGRWGGWESLGGNLSSAPALASWGGFRLDLFAQGADNELWHRWNYGHGWSGWEPLGGALTSGPGAVSWSPSRIDVFARGANGGLWHKPWDSAWGTWEPLGGLISEAPAASSWGPGQLDVAVRGNDNALWHNQFGSPGWRGWQLLGGTLSSAPAATAWTAASNVMGAVPYHHQDYELSCEEASLQMAIAHQGVYVSQGQELADIGIDWRAGYYSGGTLRWGDPYQRFVGNPSGSEVALTGYGTYFSTISGLSGRYGANVLRNGEGVAPVEVYRAVLQNHPVVTWVSFDWAYHSPGAWLTFDGRWVQYEGPVEHTVTVVGVSGDSVYVFNPWFGPQWVSKATFEAGYATYHQMAVVLQ
jgi:uncharacterized protein YvpB